MVSRLKIFLRLAVETVNQRLQRLSRRLVRKIAEIVLTDLDLTAALADIGAASAFEREHFMEVPFFKSRTELYAHALRNVIPTAGLFLEFGVYKGNSINRLAQLSAHRWYGFDSFVGLPETWTPGARKGAFSTKARLPPIRNNVTLVPGFFEETLPKFAHQHRTEPVRFVHIDCDLYSATAFVLDTLDQMMEFGCVVVFDEYFNYPDWRDGEYKAFTEYVSRAGRGFEYVGYVRHGTQVAVRLL